MFTERRHARCKWVCGSVFLCSWRCTLGAIFLHVLITQYERQRAERFGAFGPFLQVAKMRFSMRSVNRADICPPELEREKELELEPELEREREKAPEALPPARALLGKYHNVSLSSAELDALKRDLPEKWQYYIDRLSCHMASSGKTYQNHAATIYKWAQEDAAKAPPAAKTRGTAQREYTYEAGESL